MMRVPRLREVLASVFALSLPLFTSGRAQAQGTATITGKVTSEAGAPIAGANVLVQSMNVGTTTRTDGAYTLTVQNANGQQVTVTARFIGFAPLSRPITLTPGAQTLNFTLKADPFRLEQVVVTGVAEATSAKKLSFSVSSVTEDQLKQVPASSPVAALQGKVPGARISVGRGNPGAPPTIRLRGSTNLAVGGSTPLILVDGVITKNSIADIDANDIESIEVLKGAAAASFYGSDAANGVINIKTKRGASLADNKLSFSVRSEYGQSGVERFVPLAQHHAYALNPDGTIQTGAGGTRILDPDGIADNAYPNGPEHWRNQLKEWLTNGQFQNHNLQLGLRRGNTNFATSYSISRNQGILPFTDGQLRHNLRLNVDQGILSNLDLSASVTYGLNNNDYDPNNADGWFALMQAPPDLDLRQPNGDDSIPYYPALPDNKSPNARGNPLYQLANEQWNLRRERLLGSFATRYRPFQWLRLEASYGTDRLNLAQSQYQPRDYLGEGGQETPGSQQKRDDRNVAQNTQVSATASKLFFGNILSTTRGAYLFEDVRTDRLDAGASSLGFAQVPDLSNGEATSITVGTSETVAKTRDYIISQGFDIRDRYILDGLYRRDGSSLFGPNSRWSDFYRISGAYRISEDFKIPGVQELKIRAARGTAGLRPNFDYRYETYTLSNGIGTKQQVGNKDLKPAIQTENEFGLNATFLDRFDLELVQANRKTKGAFLNVPLSQGSSGGFFNQWQNIADVGAKTTELSLQTRVIDTRDWSYSFSLTGDHTSQKIDKLGVAPFRVNAGGQGQNVFYYKEGEPLGIIYGVRWVRSIAELHDNPANASINDADYVVNPAGFVVKASTRGLPSERPIAYVDATGNNQFKIGDVNPDFNFGWANNLRWKNFSLYALFDGQKGGQVYNFTKQWMFQDFRHADEDQASKPADQRIPLNFYSAGLYNGLVASDYFVEDGSYVKLRELNISYQLPTSLVSRVGLGNANSVRLAIIGRNLKTWTKYTGFDPDVTSGSDFNFKIDGFRYPNFRTITGQIEVTF